MARTASPSLCAYQWTRSHSQRCSRGSARGTREPPGAEEHALEHAAPRRLRPVLAVNPHDLDLGRVEQKRGEPIQVAGVERGAEGIEYLWFGRSFTLILWLDELAPPAMQRGLDCARR